MKAIIRRVILAGALITPLITSLPTGAVIAGQNGKLLYAESPNGATQLISQDTSGADRTNVTPTNSTNILRSATWSPDGSYVYYIKEGTTYGSAIYAAKPDKSFEMRISNYSSPTDYDDIALSPDGKHIFYSNGACVGVLDIETRANGCVINSIGASYIYGIAVSPDGNLLAFGTQYGVYTYNIGDIYSTTQITTNQNGARVLDWSPDGTKIAYTTSQNGGQPLLFTNSSGAINSSFDTDSSHASDIYHDAAFSPDSTSIAYNKGGFMYVSNGFTSNSPTTLVQSTGVTAGVDWQSIGDGVGTTLPLEPFKRGVHRFYNPTTKHHFYTASETEAQHIRDTMSNIWTFEGVLFSTSEITTCSANQSVYRFWSDTKQSHFYTINKEERDHIIANYPQNIWRYEGVAYCAYATAVTNTPIYRFWSDTQQSHFYTASEAERDSIIATYPSNVWRYEGTAYWSYD